ncbi:MAG: tyrosine-protein phosphatase [Oscillospiraceae bacterium]|nr:tyrosine-protein phosphatase [Oscillospiraceae bacterium]
MEEINKEEQNAAEREKTAASGEQERKVKHHHHHSNHHHRRHRHHHSHKRKKQKKFSFHKLKNSIVKNKKFWFPLAIFLLSGLVLLAVLGVVELISKDDGSEQPQKVQGTDGVVIMAVPAFEEEQVLVNNATKLIVETASVNIASHELLADYLEVHTRLDIGVPMSLNFYLADKPTEYSVDKYTVEVAENDSFQDAWEYTLEADAQKLELYNLKTGTSYYYRINVHFTNGIVSSAGGSFQTAASPRILTIGGVYNARDIGGWKTSEGKTVKQGLLYRGTELDGAVKSEYKLTDTGRSFMRDYLGIQMEMDLRNASENPQSINALGEDIKHMYFGVSHYTDVFLEGNREAIRQVFSELANENNYPIYMHCTYGRDRTGTVCCLLEALLGVQKEDLWRDYQLSALENKYQDIIAFGGFLLTLENQPGESLQAKTENYLLSIGVTEEEIAAIRSIFLDE